MKCRAKPIELEYHEFDGDFVAAEQFAGSHQVDEDYWIPNVVPAKDFMTDPGDFAGVVWVSNVKRWVGLRIGDFLLMDGDILWAVSAEKFHQTFDVIPEMKIEIHVNGVITSTGIEREIGKMIQKSSRFR